MVWYIFKFCMQLANPTIHYMVYINEQLLCFFNEYSAFVAGGKWLIFVINSVSKKIYPKKWILVKKWLTRKFLLWFSTWSMVKKRDCHISYTSLFQHFTFVGVLKKSINVSLEFSASHLWEGGM